MMTTVALNLFLCLALLSKTISGEEIYENSTNICHRCDCINNTDSLTLNCANDNLRHILSNWPPHGKILVGIFSFNNLTTLQKLPTSDAKAELVFDHCGIEQIENSAFADVRNVDMVDLSYNQLTSEALTAGVFRGPFNDTVVEPLALQKLNLAHNQIHSLKKKLFANLPQLKELNLEGNNFKILDIHTQLALASLSNLETLNLADDMLTDLVEEAMTGFKKLREINLSNNDIDMIPESLSHVGNTLENLIIDNNPIIELDGNSFLSMHSVIYLSLNNLTQLKYVNANAFSPMKHLKVLKLSNNVLLSGIDKDAFGNNHTIIELYLNDNSLEHLDKNLLSWSTLRALKMNRNRFYCNCDLYNITSQLSNEITRTEDGATCIDPRNQNNVQIYRLKRDICDVKFTSKYGYRQMRQNFTLLRIALVALSITVIVGTFTVIGISYAKWKRVKRNLTYPFTSQVTYNPLTTQDRF